LWTENQGQMNQKRKQAKKDFENALEFIGYERG